MKYLANASAYAAMFDLLLNEGGTTQDIEEESGLNGATIRRLVLCLKRRNVVHICRWDTDTMGRFSKPVYKLGNKADVRKPPPKSREDRHKKSYEKRREVSLRLGISLKEVRLRQHVVPVLLKGKQSSDKRVSKD